MNHKTRFSGWSWVSFLTDLKLRLDGSSSTSVVPYHLASPASQMYTNSVPRESLCQLKLILLICMVLLKRTCFIIIQHFFQVCMKCFMFSLIYGLSLWSSRDIFLTSNKALLHPNFLLYFLALERNFTHKITITFLYRPLRKTKMMERAVWKLSAFTWESHMWKATS